MTIVASTRSKLLSCTVPPGHIPSSSMKGKPRRYIIKLLSNFRRKYRLAFLAVTHRYTIRLHLLEGWNSHSFKKKTIILNRLINKRLWLIHVKNTYKLVEPPCTFQVTAQVQVWRARCGDMICLQLHTL